MNRSLVWPACGCLVAFGATVVLLQNAVGGAAIETATRGLAAITEKEAEAGNAKPISRAQAETRLMGLAEEYTRPWRQWSRSPQSMYSRAGMRPIPPIATELVWLEDERQPSDEVLLATIVVTKSKQAQPFPCVMDRTTERVCVCADGQWITAEAWLKGAPTPAP